ncbi:hypothetical protein NDU88_004003 [Pleurodeles waltl]|uniref:Uncharacterized protein n=1 Tax=Pleurodeles waltl TaxID=8319 RepID=A0AAV7WUB2_PLEWA|nr:hypothetical protein NDU88_004003 [Pleurodeles waltl]
MVTPEGREKEADLEGMLLVEEPTLWPSLQPQRSFQKTAEAAGARIPPVLAVFLAPYYDFSAGPAGGNSVIVRWPSGKVTSTLLPARNRASGNADVQRVQ